MIKDLELKKLSKLISKTDLDILKLLKRRNELAKQVAQYKIANNLEFVRLNVEKERITQARKWAEANGIDPNFAEQIIYSVINESCKQQLIELEKSL
jgi:chorismate mutase